MKRYFGYAICLWLSVVMLSAQMAQSASDSFGARTGETGWQQSDDRNADGVVDGYDLAMRSLHDSRTVRSKTGAYRADRILVKFVPRLTVPEMQRIVAPDAPDTGKVRALTGLGYQRIVVPETETVEAFCQRMKQHTSVLDVQFDYICQMFKTPNDNYYPIQWNFHHVKASRAWDLTSGGHPDVVVAIIDTGVAYENYGEYQLAPDFAGTAFTAGYDFINNDSHPNDDEGHGTHVAGTVAETTDNAIGAAGLAYRCTLMPIKVLDGEGVGSSSALAEGVRWAADNGADVINMSLGFPSGSSGGSVVREAIRYAYNKGIILVAAAGNEGNDAGYNGGINYPAAHPEVVAVGAIRYDKRTTNYSNYGSAITCVAPGGKVNLDQNGDGQSDGILQQTISRGNPTNFRYYFYEGTSQASPHVAAAAAMFVSRRGGGPEAFFQAIRETSEDLGSSGFDQKYGYGLIDIEKIVSRGQGWGAN